VEWQQDVSDPSEFLSTLKVDLYPEEVYTFTPKGKVVILPRDATPIDFAYTIHTEVGHTCTGAKVNGRIVPLRHRLRNGDIVEIMTQPGHTPSRDWLGFVRSSRARNKINHWLRAHQRERAIEIGKKLIEKEARKYRIVLKNIEEKELERVASEYGLGGVSDLYAGIGYGKFPARQVLGRVVPASAVDGPPTETAPDTKAGSGLGGVIRRVFGGSGDGSAISVKGHDDMLVYRARCCNPIRGEQIVGYITRGKGVAVHSTNCSNVLNLLYEPERRIAVEWSKKGDTVPGRPGTYPVKITIFCDDRAGLLKNLTAVISDDNTNIRHLDVRTAETQAYIDVVVDIEDMKHLERITAGVRKVQGVREVQRVKKL
jgi:GTP pyrophosphokinase